LTKNKISFIEAPSRDELTPAEIGERAKLFTYLIECTPNEFPPQSTLTARSLSTNAGQQSSIVPAGAALLTFKLVSDWNGESTASANTQWSFLTPSGDVIKEVSGKFPRVILPEGEYRVVARDDNRTYQRSFRVVAGVDGEVEVCKMRLCVRAR
jgi:hypothetical protein